MDIPVCNREFVSFLNEASLEFGGRLVAPLSVKYVRIYHPATLALLVY